jgi:lipopolysaccharide export system protein LptA
MCQIVVRTFLLLISVINLCFALPEDRKETMKLSAGSADLDQQVHRGVYIDNVILDQGSTHIRAAKAITEGNAKNQLIKAIIQGNKEAQAHYWTLTDPKKPPMHAFADTIYYYPIDNLIKLVGNARIEQGADSFSGPHITYDTLHHHVVSKSNGQGPTTIVFHPGTNS